MCQQPRNWESRKELTSWEQIRANEGDAVQVCRGTEPKTTQNPEHTQNTSKPGQKCDLRNEHQQLMSPLCSLITSDWLFGNHRNQYPLKLQNKGPNLLRRWEWKSSLCLLILVLYEALDVCACWRPELKLSRLQTNARQIVAVTLFVSDAVYTCVHAQQRPLMFWLTQIQHTHSLTHTHTQHWISV